MHRPAVVLLLPDRAVAAQVRGLLGPGFTEADLVAEADLVVVGAGQEDGAEQAVGVVVALGATARPGWIALPEGAFDRLAELAAVVQATSQRARADQQELCAVLAHDVKNPLGAALANVGFLSDELASGSHDVVEALSEITEALGRSRAIVDDALLLTQASASGLDPTSQSHAARAVFDDVIRKARPNALARQVELRAVQTDAEVRGDGDLLRRAVSALVEAALKQCTRRATVELACTRGVGVTRLVVRHDGRKLADQPQARALAEGRARTGAVGMPLALARVIALSHGGRLDVTASSDWPTELALVLPE